MTYQKIDFKDAAPGDWLVDKSGEVRMKVQMGDGAFTTTEVTGLWNVNWQRLGFHVEREDPPKVVRRFSATPEGYVTMQFPADLLNELEKAAREWFRTPSSQCRSEHRLFTALNACGIGTPKSGEGEDNVGR